VKGETILMGVNDDKLKNCDISSNASCTTNATSPIIAVLKEAIGIEKAILNTVHAYTATQSLVDGPAKKDVRKGRAAALNIIPSTTGAAIATTLAHPELEGNFDGIAMRIPVPVGSLVDITFIAKRETSVEEVNDAFRKASEDKRWQNIFAATDEPIVSSDIVGSRVGSIADLSFTRVVGGNLVKVLGWYDNETSYTQTLVEHVAVAASHLGKKKD
jgi:glyceraldehyde 3-phosphate dehydrogenase